MTFEAVPPSPRWGGWSGRIYLVRDYRHDLASIGEVPRIQNRRLPHLVDEPAAHGGAEIEESMMLEALAVLFVSSVILWPVAQLSLTRR